MPTGIKHGEQVTDLTPRYEGSNEHPDSCQRIDWVREDGPQHLYVWDEMTCLCVHHRAVSFSRSPSSVRLPQASSQATTDVSEGGSRQQAEAAHDAAFL